MNYLQIVQDFVRTPAEINTRYVLQHQALPTGTVQVPYDDKEMGKPSNPSFAVDFDALGRQQ